MLSRSKSDTRRGGCRRLGLSGTYCAIQRKRYTPESKIPSRGIRDLLDAKVHFKVDVAIFVATMYVSGPAEKFATENDILAVHRDHLGLWNWGSRGAGWVARIVRRMLHRVIPTCLIMSVP